MISMETAYCIHGDYFRNLSNVAKQFDFSCFTIINGRLLLLLNNRFFFDFNVIIPT